MKSLTAFLLSIGCVLLLTANHGFRASATEDAPRQPGHVQWEHLALQFNGIGDDFTSQLEKLGEDGWELVTVLPVNEHGTTTRRIHYFKRPK